VSSPLAAALRSQRGISSTAAAATIGSSEGKGGSARTNRLSIPVSPFLRFNSAISLAMRTPVAANFGTLVDVLRARAATRPAATAFVFLDHGEIEQGRVTYAGLDAQARAIAAHLQAGFAPGDRALLVYPPGLDYIAAFFGCLYAGLIAVPVYPPSPGRENRLQFRFLSALRDATPVVALTTAEVKTAVEGAQATHPELGTVQWLSTDHLVQQAARAQDLAASWTAPRLRPDTIAFLQYTSGSTATPKGVMVTHGNLLHNEAMIRAMCDHDEHSTFVGWLPLYHDMGLIGNVLQPLYLGSSCILMSPAAFLQKPRRWLEAVTRYRAATSGGPNFAYDLCVRKIAPAAREGLDLSHWTTAFNGAEPIRADTLARFAEAFEPYGFRRQAFFPCYGMAEGTLIVSGSRANTAPRVIAVESTGLDAHRFIPAPADALSASPAGRPARRFVSCGRPAGGQRVVIVHPDRRTVCAAGEVGEIWVCGRSVARGYWNRPEETRQAFHARPGPTDRSASRAPDFLRTGDLGAIQEGDLFVVGRLKDLIVVRGRNLHPEDIEATAERAHPALRPGCGAAVAIEIDGEEQVAIVHEVENVATEDVEAIARLIREAVTREHDVPAHTIVLVRRGTIPKTTSGKIQRRACGERLKAGSLQEIGRDVLTRAETIPPAHATRLPRYVQGVIAEALSDLRKQPVAFDPNAPLTRDGLDSLAAHQMQMRFEVDLGVVMSASEILDGHSLTSLISELRVRIDRRESARESNDTRVATVAGSPFASAHAFALASTSTPNPAPAPGADADDAAADAVRPDEPLSYNQRSLWFLARLAPESAAYHIGRAVRLRGALDVAALRQAVQQLADRHAALRTTFVHREGQVAQRVHRHLDCPVTVRAIPVDWSEEALLAHLRLEARRPFDLEASAPFRLQVWTRSSTESVLLVCAHHVLLDLWSLELMLREIQQRYDAAVSGREASFPPVTADYVDYVRWQRELLAAPEGERQRRYWLDALHEPPLPLNLPSDRPRPAVQQYRGGSHHFHLDAALSRDLGALAGACGTTIATLLLAAFQLLLLRISGQTEVSVGVPSSGRSHANFTGTLGYCVNPLVCRARLAGDEPFTAWLARVHRTMTDATAHQDYPFALLVEQLHLERDPSRSPLFQAMFVWQRAQGPGADGVNALALNLPGAALRLIGLPADILPLEPETAQFDLRLMMATVEGRLAGWLEYNSDLFKTAAQHVRGLETILRGIASNPATAILDVPLLSEAERQQIVYGWNETASEFSSDRCIHDLIEEQAAYAPSAPAVVDDAGTLTYRELNGRANQLARLLRTRGVGSGSMVAVYMDRSAHMIVAVLAVLKSGAAYVPLDPAYPAVRVQGILQSMRVRCAIVSERHRGQLAAIDTITLDQTIDPQLAGFSAANGVARTSPDDLAYVIFTSGSTGTPKGVIVQHRPVINLVEWVNRTFRVGELDRLLFVTSLCFDLSVYDIFGILAAGGSIRVASDRDLADPDRLVAVLSTEPITFWDSAPAALQQLMPFIPPAADAGRGQPLRLVFLSGDWIPVALPDQIRQAFPRARVIALGGATEATVWSNAFVVERVDPEWVSIPYGRPIQNSRYHVLDTRVQPCPPGVPGDLYIGGVCLSTGYANEPVLTAQKYIPDPWGLAGERLYRTGDLARYFADGEIEFLGRKDLQVKVRGFRVELGEIETALAAHPQVREAVVTARGETRGVKTLVGYVVPRLAKTLDGQEDGGRVTGGVLLAHLRSRLPEYMVPSTIVCIDAIPLTANGKLNREALPAPERIDTDAETFVAPRTAIEQRVAAIWADVLERASIGIHDSFFALGGHSLLMTQVISRIRSHFGVDLPVADFFQEPTVAELALRVLERQAQHEGADTLERLLDRVDMLSTAEIAAMLGESAASVAVPAAAPAVATDAGAEAIGEASLASAPRALAVAPTAPGVAPVAPVAPVAMTEDVDLPDLATITRLLSEADPRESETASTAATISMVGLLTCDRPDHLQRGLASYLANCATSGRSPDFVVLDDSRDPVKAEATRAHTAALARQFGLRVRYVDRAGRRELARALATAADVPLDLAMFALCGDDLGVSTAGALRNALAVETAGSCVLTVDDDTVCRIGAPPAPRDEIAFVSASYAPELYPYVERQTLLASMNWTDRDLLALHEAVLGRSVAACAAGRDAIALDQASPRFRRRLARREGQIVASFTGYIGDCGWASPTNYLFMSGPSLDRLTHSDAAYQAACTSRECLQIVNRLTISDRADYVMMAFAGLDHRDLLPPFLPIGRGQDNLFGTTLTRMAPSLCVAHLPWGLLHAPADTRRFRAGEVTRSGSGLDLATLVRLCLESIDTGFPRTRAAGLARLGSHLQDIAAFAPRDFDGFVQARWRDEVSRLIAHLDGSLAAHRGRAPAWEADGQTFIRQLRRSLTQPESGTPLDLLYGRSVEEARPLAQHIVRRFGDLLIAWPALVAARCTLDGDRARHSRPTRTTAG
jgi:amino acid adenylation domain-containing protein